MASFVPTSWSDEFQLVPFLSIVEIVLGIIVFAVIYIGIIPPLGKFERKGWGFTVSGRLGWCFYESIPPLVFLISFFSRPSNASIHEVTAESLPTRYVLLFLYIAHYIHRAYIYPFAAPAIAPTNFTVIALASTFNCLNGYVNGRTAGYVGSFTGMEMQQWIFWGGVVVFIIGMGINIISDHTMFALRRKRDQAKGKKSEDQVVLSGRTYVLPRGFLWDYVAAPHYFGEVVEWTGYAIAAGTPAALAFAVFTFGNLVPRGIQAHDWYRQTFGEKYPAHRRAVFPFLW